MTFRDYLKDEYSAAWAAITTVVCVVILSGSNVLLFAAAGGAKADDAAPLSWQLLWLISAGLVVAVFLVTYFVASAAQARSSKVTQKRRLRFPLSIACASSSLALLCCLLALSVSWLAGTGRAVLWGPIVATSLGTVSVVSFGGYYLASRRARIAIAATWLLFFLSLLSFMLTLEVLVAAVDGDTPGITAGDCCTDR